MFNFGWGEIVLIGIVALIAIGPKELPTVLRSVGQMMAKVRRMAAEFQGQFQEAMREAEMADVKKSFDEIREAASSFTAGGLMTSLEKSAAKSLDVDVADKPAATAVEPKAAPTTPETPAPETFAEAAVHEASAPLAITPEVQPQGNAPAASDTFKDAKAS